MVQCENKNLSKYFFGTLKDIYELNRDDVEVVEFYHSKFAEVYDKMCYSGSTQQQNEALAQIDDDMSCSDEIEFYRSYLALSGGKKVLELACGSGRVTIPLALKKIPVTGVDLSRDMLQILSDRIEEKYIKAKRYIKIYQDDITNMQKINEKFNLVIFPATTIRLLDVDLIKFIDSIYDYLEEGGYFIFDFVELKNEKKELLIENFYNLSYESDGVMSTVFFQEEHDLEKRKSRVNFYVNTFGEKIGHYLSYTYLNILDQQILNDIIQKTRFAEVSYHQYMETEDNVFSFCVIKK